MTAIPNTPFGHSIHADDIIDTLSFFDGWEERYKYIIDLGKELPPMADADKVDDNIIRGCQSQVWIKPILHDGRWHFAVDSDAFIVKGLLAVVLAAYNNREARGIIEFDIENYFNQLGLLKHLSPTRGSGMKAMVARIQEIARSS